MEWYYNTFDHYVGHISSRVLSDVRITNVHDVYLVTNIENIFCYWMTFSYFKSYKILY